MKLRILKIQRAPKYQEQQRFSVVGGEIQKTYKQMIKGSICLMESHPYIKDTRL